MNSQKTPNKWFMFIILLISAIAVIMSQAKITGVMGEVAAMLNVSTANAAWLMSLFTVAGIILSIPGAAIMSKIGPKNLLLCLMVCLFVGNVLGGLTSSFAVMMVSRIIEGISYAMIIMVGIELINIWFADGGAGTATGAFNTFAPIANFITLNASIPLVKSFGLKNLWWAVAIFSAVCFVLVLLFIKVPERSVVPGATAIPAKSGSLGEAVKNPSLLVVCVMHLCLSFVLFGFLTCYPQLFLFYNLPDTTSNFYTSLNGLFGIPVCIIMGIIIEKSKKPFLTAIIGAIGTILLCFTMPYLSSGTYIVHVLASAIFPGGMVMTSVFIIVPQLAKRPQLIGYSMGLLNTLYYIGVFASTPLILGMTNGNTSWTVASLVMTAASVVILVCAFIAMSMAKKQKAVDNV